MGLLQHSSCTGYLRLLGAVTICVLLQLAYPTVFHPVRLSTYQRGCISTPGSIRNLRSLPSLATLVPCLHLVKSYNFEMRVDLIYVSGEGSTHRTRCRNRQAFCGPRHTRSQVERYRTRGLSPEGSVGCSRRNSSLGKDLGWTPDLQVSLGLSTSHHLSCSGVRGCSSGARARLSLRFPGNR